MTHANSVCPKTQITPPPKFSDCKNVDLSNINKQLMRLPATKCFTYFNKISNRNFKKYF